MKVKCLIVEDEPIAQDILKSYISKTDFLEVTAQFTNAIDAFGFLQNQKVDLLFLDIKMPQMSGIELLRSLTVKPRVVITSAYRYYATEAFELDVIDYLLKPYSFERFLKAVSKVISTNIHSDTSRKVAEHPFIFIKGNKQLHKIFIEDILFIESQRDYLKFHMKDRADVVTRQTIGYYEDFLPAHMFLRVHRSFIVALNKITLVEATRIFIGSSPVPIGRNYKVQVHESLRGISA